MWVLNGVFCFSPTKLQFLKLFNQRNATSNTFFIDYFLEAGNSQIRIPCYVVTTSLWGRRLALSKRNLITCTRSELRATSNWPRQTKSRFFGKVLKSRLKFLSFSFALQFHFSVSTKHRAALSIWSQKFGTWDATWKNARLSWTSSVASKCFDGFLGLWALVMD